LDVLREPRIAVKGRPLDGSGVDGKPAGELNWMWGLAPHIDANGEYHAECVFLRSDNTCEIYSTRPGDCVSFRSGSPRCKFPSVLDCGSVMTDEQLASEAIREIVFDSQHHAASGKKAKRVRA